VPCDYLNSPLSCAIGDTVGTAAQSAWDAVCRSFADAAVDLLEAFATAFVAFPPVDVTSGGVRSVYGLSLGIAAVVTGLVALLQIGRTAFTHDGSAMARAFIGVGKAVLAFIVTLTLAGVSLKAADELTVWIVERSFGTSDGLRAKLVGLVNWSPQMASTLMLIIAVVGIALTGVLWFQLLVRNAAAAVMIASSPIAASGMASEATKQWYSTLVWAVVRLIILKPVIALVFAVGFGLLGNSESEDITSMLTGLTVLLLAVLAWPAIGRFFTFAQAHMGGPNGLASLIGASANATAGSGSPGVSPDEFSQHAEARTMGAVASRGGLAGGAAGGAETAAAAGSSVMPLLGAGLALAQRAVNSLVGQSEQMAGHAGLSGANPHANPAGQLRHRYPTSASPPSAAGGGDTTAGPSTDSPAPPPSPQTSTVTASVSTRTAVTTPPPDGQIPVSTVSPPPAPPPSAPQPSGPVAPPEPQGDTPA
jgi:hypothetical protein